MLPFHKRNVQNSQAEDLSSDDIVEVVHKVRHAASLAPAAKLNSTMRSAQPARRNDRPQMPAPVPASRREAPMTRFDQEDEEEMTCLMPAKGLLIPPPASKPSRRPVARETSTSFRPMPNAIPRSPLYSTHETTPLDKRTASQRLAYSTPQPMAVVAARQEMFVPKAPASLAPMAMPSSDSEPHIHAGATVLTARTLKSRPTASMAAALVAMGIFAGLVTAAIARGDFSGDSKVASASAQSIGEQVIPSQPASSPAPVYTASNSPSMAIGSPVVMPTPMTTGVVAAASLPVSAPAAKTVHVAAASPKPVYHAPKAASPAPAAPAVEKAEKTEVAVADKPEKKSKGKKGGKDDSSMASAKEAQALADAQLAASL